MGDEGFQSGPRTKLAVQSLAADFVRGPDSLIAIQCCKIAYRANTVVAIVLHQ